MPDSYRLPLKSKILYSVGQLGVTIPTFFISTYIYVYYAPTDGQQILPASIVGTAYLIGTLIQALSNPFIGNASDRMKHRFGRRRFFMITGFIPLSILFALIWFPVFSSLANEILLFIYMVGFNFLYAYVVLPYLSLIPEISVEPNDRVRLTTISAYFSIFGIILASVVPTVLLLFNFPFYDVGLVLATIVLAAFLVVFVSIRETAVVKEIPREFSIVSAFVNTFKNRTFSFYIISYLFFQFGFYFFLSSLGYYVEDIVMPNNPDFKTYVGIFTLIAVVSAVFFSPVLVKYTEKRGEKRSFILFTILLGIAMILTYFVGMFTGVGNFIQMAAIVVFAGLGLTSYFILPNAIVSEIIDEDEILTGYRREAMYFGVQGLLERIPSGLAGFVLGLWISDLYNPTLNLFYIRFLGVIGGIFTVMTGLFFILVPLKEGIKSEAQPRNE